MSQLEPLNVEEIIRNLDSQAEVFFIGCSGWKEICNPGGEVQLQQLKKDLTLRGVSFTGTLIVFIAGYFISPLLKIGTINDAITIPTMLVTLLGAIVLLWIVKAVRR